MTNNQVKFLFGQIWFGLLGMDWRDPMVHLLECNVRRGVMGGLDDDIWYIMNEGIFISKTYAYDLKILDVLYKI